MVCIVHKQNSSKFNTVDRIGSSKEEENNLNFYHRAEFFEIHRLFWPYTTALPRLGSVKRLDNQGTRIGPIGNNDDSIVANHSTKMASTTTLSPTLMVQWKIILNDRKLILEGTHFPLPWLWEEEHVHYLQNRNWHLPNLFIWGAWHCRIFTRERLVMEGCLECWVCDVLALLIYRFLVCFICLGIIMHLCIYICM